MSIKLANDVKDLRNELKVVQEELHQIKKKLNIRVKPQPEEAKKG